MTTDTTRRTRPGDPFRGRRRLTWVALTGLVFVSFGLAIGTGTVPIPMSDALGVIASHFGLGELPDGAANAVVWNIRMPRWLLGFTVGAALGIVGAVLQGSLRNELADPHLLGIGPGAAIGAALGASAGGTRGAIAGGVFAGVLTAFALRRLASGPTIDPTRIILLGAALSLALGAWVGFVVFGSDRGSVPPLEFWLLGSLSAATWSTATTTAVFVTLSTAGLFMMSKTLDVLALGEREASYLGVDTHLVGTVLLIVSGAIVGVTVGAVGVVAFVGLVVPLLIRKGVGPSFRHVLPAAVVGGGVFVLLADVAARSIINPVEIPVGLVTAAVGGPVFLWLIARKSNV
ncbi:MAG: iron ABC transporter permease [Acidimicrobiia bacterium]|nr:MAG: iron ABC transporter permease [Acidimicrobiia bacterium]